MADSNPFLSQFRAAPAGGERIVLPAHGGTTYVILATPRTGSTYLTHTLTNTGQLGTPNEFLNYDDRGGISETADKFAIQAPQEYFSFLRATFTSANGVFGIKCSWPQFTAATEVVDLDSFLGPDPKWFFLRRRNLVAQAVSMTIAEATGVYHAYQLTGPPPEPPPLDLPAVLQGVRDIVGWEAAIVDHLLLRGATFVELLYEDVTADEQSTVDVFATVLEVAPLTARVGLNPIVRLRYADNGAREAQVRQDAAAELEVLTSQRPPLRDGSQGT